MLCQVTWLRWLPNGIMGCRTTKLLGVVAPMILAQPGGNGGMGGGGGNPHFECPDAGGFAGDSDYIGAGLKPIPVRGNVGCVDAGPLATRPTVENRQFWQRIAWFVEMSSRARPAPCVDVRPSLPTRRPLKL